MSVRVFRNVAHLYWAAGAEDSFAIFYLKFENEYVVDILNKVW